MLLAVASQVATSGGAVQGMLRGKGVPTGKYAFVEDQQGGQTQSRGVIAAGLPLKASAWPSWPMIALILEETCTMQQILMHSHW